MMRSFKIFVIMIFIGSLVELSPQSWTKIDMKSIGGEPLPEASIIMFASKDTGWFAKSLYPAKLYKTIDGGKSWTMQRDSVNSIWQIAVASIMQISYVTAIDNQWYGFNSSDGGVTWNSSKIKEYKGSESYLLHYIDSDHLLWCCRGYPYIYSVSEKSWTRQDTTLFFSLPSHAQFINNTTGWISMQSNPGATEAGSIAKTTNGGKSWFYQGRSIKMPYFPTLRSFSFVDSSVGYTIGYTPFASIGLLYSTIDGGDTWTNENSFMGGEYYDILAINKDKLLLASDNGTVLLSLDGGKAIRKIETGTSVKLKQIQRVEDGNTVYILGEENTLLKFDLTLLTDDVQAKDTPTSLQQTPIVFDAYPNPFNSTTKISFRLQRESTISLKVYDVMGREIAELVSESLPAGEYTKEWSADRNPSGVYFYRLVANNFSKTKKIILQK